MKISNCNEDDGSPEGYDPSCQSNCNDDDDDIDGDGIPNEEDYDPDGDFTYSVTNLIAGLYEFEIIDANGCLLTDVVELVQPDEFSQDIEYVINASCDDESNGMIIIRTSGGNPPLQYIVDSSSNVDTTYSPSDS